MQKGRRDAVAEDEVLLRRRAAQIAGQADRLVEKAARLLTRPRGADGANLDIEGAFGAVGAMADKLLANPVIEDFRIVAKEG